MATGFKRKFCYLLIFSVTCCIIFSITYKRHFNEVYFMKEIGEVGSFFTNKIHDKPTCTYYDISPFDSPVLPHLRNRTFTCNTPSKPWTEIVSRNYLVLHRSRMSNDSDHISCRYSSIKYRQSPEFISLTPDSPTLLQEGDLFVVQCFLQDHKVVYQNVHTTINPNVSDVVKEKMKRAEQEKRFSTKLKLNVMITMNDAMSRCHTIRKLPKMFQYLTQTMGGLVFKGYNALSEHSIKNFCGALAGVDLDATESRDYDSFPLIWNYFSRRNYVTLFSEDGGALSTFYYPGGNRGFKKQPTDYIQHSFFQFAGKIVRSTKNEDPNYNPKCGIHGKRMYHHMFEWVKSFVKNFHSSPRFSMTQLNELSHGIFNEVQVADEYYENFYKDLQEGGFLKDTLVIFMSDHGASYNTGFRATNMGRIEASQPVLIMCFPKTFIDNYPVTYDILKRNTERVTSPYDLYYTLIDIAHQNFHPKKYSQDSKGLSLFGDIPLNRTCASAGIPEALCPCVGTKQIIANTTGEAQRAARLGVAKINSELRLHHHLCRKLRLNSVVSCVRVLNELHVSQEPEYTVTFSTSPGNGLFETTVSRDGSIVSAIERLSVYGDQSKCILSEPNVYQLRHICLCKNYNGSFT